MAKPHTVFIRVSAICPIYMHKHTYLCIFIHPSTVLKSGHTIFVFFFREKGRGAKNCGLRGVFVIP